MEQGIPGMGGLGVQNPGSTERVPSKGRAEKAQRAVQTVQRDRFN